MPGQHYTIINLLLLFLGTVQLSAQQPRPTEEGLPLEAIEQIVMPELDNEALREAESEAQQPGRPPHFAKAMSVDVRPATHGSWELLPDGDALWRLRIQSTGAYSINLGFSLFYMPPGGRMLLYDPQKSQVLGPFTDADNEKHNQLWTPVLAGDELVLEVRLPAEHRDELQLWLTAVNHDFLNFYGFATGECHLDIICGEEDGWPIVDLYRDAIQSVAVYGLGGETLCTGFLVNNTNQDCSPFFMTAYHCEVNANNAPSVVAYWNYQNSYCRPPGSVSSGNPGNGSLNNFNTGAIYRAGDSGKDFVLLELDDPVAPSADAYFAGWTREASPPSDTMICIHHPDGAEKRISFAFTESYIGSWSSGSSQVENGDHIIVPQWTIGSTEFGSSGAPLFDRNKRVTGQLHGGAASCSNSGYDSFGWFRAAWNGSAPNKRLSDWLDPAGTGVFVLDGHWNISCNISLELETTDAQLCSPGTAEYQITVGDAFDSPVVLSVDNLPAGISYDFSPNPVLPGGTAELQLEVPADNVPEGYLEFEILAQSQDNALSTEASLLVVNEPPPQIGLLHPADQADGLPLAPEINWAASSNATAYDLQLAKDSSFNNLVVDVNNIGQDFFSTAALQAYETYFCRVRARNLCGIGPWSATTSFRTAASRCYTAQPQDLPLGIPNYLENAEVSSFNTVPLEGTVADIRIRNLNIDHTFVGDLSAYLRSPSGTLIKLFDRPGYPLLPFGCPSSDLRLAFADDAPLEALELEESCAGTSPAISGEFQPMQALTGFIGEPAQGTWELIVIDNFYDDGGYILDWSLEICVTYPNQAQVFLPEGNLPACVNAPSSASLYVGTGFEDNVSLLLQNLPSGASITLDSYIAAPGTYVQLSLDSFSQVGSADFQLIATDGNNYHDCTVGVLVNDRPTRPNLQLPVDQSPVFDDPIPFRWSFGVRTDSFLLEVATDSLFEDIVFRAATSQNEFTLSEHLPQGRYYWQVQAMNECGVKTSAVSSFIRQGSVTSTSALHLGWLRLFPNPADERVHIEFEGIGAASAEGQVFNSQGQLVKQIRFQRHTQIDISSWPSGLYILRLVVGNEQFVRRIIVE